MNGNLSAFLMLSLSKQEKGADLKRLRFPSPLEGEGLGMGGVIPAPLPMVRNRRIGGW